MKILYSIFFIALVSTDAFSQVAANNFFSNKTNLVFDNLEIPTSRAAYFGMDLSSFNGKIKSVHGRQSSTIKLPMPDGSFEEFQITESTVMSKELAAKYPNIKTYEGKNATSSVRFDVSPKGLHAMLFTPKGTVYIDPINRNTVDNYQSYYKADFLPHHKGTRQEGKPIDYDPELTKQINELVAKGERRPSGTELRTYRMAISATGEYTVFHGGTVAGALSAIVTTMNRVNGIYEREVSIRMVLVDNTEELIFTDAATDGFSNNDANALIDEVQAKIDDIIGDANYDIGHGVSTGGGGLAGLGVPCQTGRKGSGITGSSSPVGDPYDVDYVAHEIGHQFGASHTFNGSSGSCGSNRSGSSAYEPGSGTTIMGYAGICSGQNIQNSSDAYFHTQSFDQIIAYSTLNQGSTCAVVTNTGNNAPVVEAGEGGFTIPISTPFKLDGSATDPNGDDLTYSWEQFDLGPAGAPESPVDNAPLFRAFSPVNEPYRVFPQINDIVNNSSTMGEILPNYTRPLKFRLTARDNQDGGGGVDYDEISFDVSDQAGPFLITEPNTATDLIALSTNVITWDVANTNKSPVNCQKVNILLSEDGGITYPHELLTDVNNDGEATVLIPDVATNQARIKVEAADNIFFDISDTNFTISTSESDDFSVFIADQETSICAPDDIALVIEVSQQGNFVTPVVLSVSDLPASYNVSFDTNPVSPGSSTTMHISNTSSEAGVFSPTVTGVADAVNHEQLIGIRVLIGSPGEVEQLDPTNETVNVSLTPRLTWMEIENADSYDVQLSDVVDFSNIIEETNVVQLSVFEVSTLLDGNTTYHWRVRANNLCGNGDYSMSSFTTVESICGSLDYTGGALTISSSGTPTIEATIDNAEEGLINDLNVNNLIGSHSYVEDLTITLISPKGTQAVLFSGICGSMNNFDLNFDDESIIDVINCPPTDKGTYKPANSLSIFNGEPSSGTWILRVQDGADEDGGQLDGWSIEFCTQPDTQPLPPTEAEIESVTSNSVTILWVDNATNETSYIVERSTDAEAFEKVADLVVDSESFMDVDLLPTTEYFYNIYAVNGGVKSESLSVSATTIKAIPSAPTALTAASSIDDIRLLWEDNSDNEEEFIIERSESDNVNFIELDNVEEDVRSYIDVTAIYGIAYFYRVSARNSGGNSEYSNEVSSGIITSVRRNTINSFVEIYPNPSSGIFNYIVKESITTDLKIEVVDVLGKVIINHEIKSSDQKEQQLDLSNYPNGIYIFKVNTDQASSVYRIMKN